MSDILEVMASAIRAALDDSYEPDPDETASAVLAALEAKDFAVVPVVPTEEMVTAGMGCGWFTIDDDGTTTTEAEGVWSAMLAASKRCQPQKEKA